MNKEMNMNANRAESKPNGNACIRMDDLQELIRALKTSESINRTLISYFRKETDLKKRHRAYIDLREEEADFVDHADIYLNTLDAWKSGVTYCSCFEDSEPDDEDNGSQPEGDGKEAMEDPISLLLQILKSAAASDGEKA